MLDLSISVISLPGLTVMTIGGEIDVSTVPDFRLALFSVCHRTSDRVILDLRDVTFFDCSGIGALVAARRQLPVSASMCLVTAHPMIHKIFAITELLPVFPIYTSLQSAMAQSQR